MPPTAAPRSRVLQEPLFMHCHSLAVPAVTSMPVDHHPVGLLESGCPTGSHGHSAVPPLAVPPLTQRRATTRCYTTASAPTGCQGYRRSRAQVPRAHKRGTALAAEIGQTLCLASEQFTREKATWTIPLTRDDLSFNIAAQKVAHNTCRSRASRHSMQNSSSHSP